MTALLCLLMGVAALALAVLLPDQRLTLGVLAIIAGAAAVALAPTGRRAVAEREAQPSAIVGARATDAGAADAGAVDAGAAPAGASEAGAVDVDGPGVSPWERATPD